MSLWNNTKIAIKLPAIIVALGVLGACVTGAFSYFGTRATLMNEIENKLTSTVEARRRAFVDWLGAIEGDLETQVENPSVLRAIEEFRAAWSQIDGDQTTYLQDWYIENNPNPTGQKENLDYASDGSVYSTVHAAYHPYFRSFLRDRGYYDMFLFDRDGNLIYTVFKELDYATNLVDGKWSKTDLGNAFRAAADSARRGQSVFFDFKPYEPSFGAAAGFISRAVFDSSGAFVGVLAFQMPVDRLNALMQEATGLGETGETYIVGGDFLMRSQSRLIEDATLLERVVRTEPVRQALDGDTGVRKARNLTGASAYAAYTPVDFMGSRFALVAEQQTNELLAPITRMRNFLIFQILIVAAVGAAVGVFGVRSITRAITEVGDAMKRVAGRALDTEVAHRDRNDEIGDIARALDEFRGSLAEGEKKAREVRFKGAAFEGSPSAIMMVDKDARIIYQNKASDELMRANADLFKTHWPTFDPDNIIGQSIDMFHKRPEHQRSIITDKSRLPFRTDISIDNVKIALNVDGVYDESGVLIGNILAWDDVTQERLNEGVLKAISKEQAMIEFTPSGEIINANANFLDATGYALEEIKGAHHRMFMPDGEANTDAYRDFWARLAAGEEIEGRFKRVNKAGAEVWLQASYTPITDRHGKTFKVVKMARDITQIVAQEREIEENEKLQEKERREREVEQAEVVAMVAEALDRIAKGDLVTRIEKRFPEAYKSLRMDFNQAADALKDAFAEVAYKVSQMRTGVHEVSQSADDLSKRTEHQATTLEETAAALDEITATVRQTAEGADEANRVVVETNKQATESGAVVSDAISAMGEIEKSSDQISQIIGVIDEIAFQTNLLALNAGVEAARAGDAGRGFAVVAQEVRALAQRSSEAAKEIKGLISASSGHVKSGVELVDKAGEALQSIVGRVETINVLVSQITLSAKEQSTSLAEVNTAMNQMDEITQQNAAMVEEATAAGHSLSSEAEDLANLVAKFDIGQGKAVETAPALAPKTKAAPAVHGQQAKVAEYAASRPAPTSNGSAAVAAEEDWSEF